MNLTMKTYISILRGINVGGKHLIRMNSLQEIYEGLGFQKVKTYIQSGNVVFQSKEFQLEELEQLISEEIMKRLDLNVPVLVRDYNEMIKILESNPFIKEDQEEISHLYITLLSESPGAFFLQNIETDTFLPDEFVFNDRAIYLSCPNGYGKTKLNNGFFENKSGGKATTRNLKTLMELVKIGEEIEKLNR
jgi:uncharacterized protein (DUF1697 family)